MSFSLLAMVFRFGPVSVQYITMSSLLLTLKDVNLEIQTYPGRENLYRNYINTPPDLITSEHSPIFWGGGDYVWTQSEVFPRLFWYGYKDCLYCIDKTIRPWGMKPPPCPGQDGGRNMYKCWSSCTSPCPGQDGGEACMSAGEVALPPAQARMGGQAWVRGESVWVRPSLMKTLY
jgi:hypothetical protein